MANRRPRPQWNQLLTRLSVELGGTEQGQLRYDAWGETTETSPDLPRIAYTGHYREREGGSYYAQQRYYRPGLGRFNRIDPWSGDEANPITLNKYLYANGNPLLYVDPDGRCSVMNEMSACHLRGDAARVGGDRRQFLESVADQYERDRAQSAEALAVGIGQALASGYRRLTDWYFELRADDSTSPLLPGQISDREVLERRNAEREATALRDHPIAHRVGEFGADVAMIAAAPEAVALRGARVSPPALRSEEAAIAAARASEQSRPVIVVESVPMGDVPYSPRGVRAELESRYGADNLVSTTVPPTSGKNVRLAGQAHPVTGVVYDSRGFPIFDDVAAFETRLPHEPFREASYTGQMRLATQDLGRAIERGEVPASRFTPQQLEQIRSGAERIDGYTWHHHQDWGRMQLVRRELHGKTGHVGGEAMYQGQ